MLSRNGDIQGEVKKILGMERTRRRTLLLGKGGRRKRRNSSKLRICGIKKKGKTFEK